MSEATNEHASVQLFWDLGTAFPAIFLVFGWLLFWVFNFLTPEKEFTLEKSIAEWQDVTIEIPKDRYSFQDSEGVRKVTFQTPKLDEEGNPIIRVITYKVKGRGHLLIRGQELIPVEKRIIKSPYKVSIRSIDEKALAKRSKFFRSLPNPPDARVSRSFRSGIKSLEEAEAVMSSKSTLAHFGVADPRLLKWYISFSEDVVTSPTARVERTPIIEWKRSIEPEEFALYGAIFGSILTIIATVWRYPRRMLSSEP